MTEASDSQKVPSLFGWWSLTCGKDQSESGVEYMPPLLHPITENATVQKILELSQNASEQLGQKSTIITFDLAVAKKAYSILWQNHVKFDNIIIRMGAFHTICALFHALGKHIRGSGFSEIIIDAGICASGSVERVLLGKHYNRALRVHRIILEALERLLIKRYIEQEETDISNDFRVLLEDLASSPCKENLLKVETSATCQDHFDQYSKYRDSVREGALGKTAQFWISYMDIVWQIMSVIRATKTNDFDTHLSSLYQLCGLFFAYDQQNYARYMPVYLLSMLNADVTHPEANLALRNANAFSVARSAIPATRNAVDITIEQTINRHAKSAGGIIGFSRNLYAYHRWCVTRHFRAQYLAETLNMADMTNDESGIHKETRPSYIMRMEDDVRKVMDSFKGFMDPFHVTDESRLYCLSSGIPASEEIAKDLLEAPCKGQSQMKQFISERLTDAGVSFHAPIKRNKFKTFQSMALVKKAVSSKNKEIELKAERNLFGQLMILAVQNNIDLAVTFTYPLGPVPWALATADGVPFKSDKAKLLHVLESNLPSVTNVPQRQTTAYICDGNALLHSLIGIPETFGQITEKIFDLLPKYSRVDFVTDSYRENSIKAAERKRRGGSEKHIVSGPKTKAPRDWKRFLLNNENKEQLVGLLLTEWQKPSYASRLRDREIFFVCKEECFLLKSQDGETVTCDIVPELVSSQEEADTRIVLHCCHINSASDHIESIQVRSPDTDVFVLLLKFSLKMEKPILFDTGTGNKRRLINVTEIAKQMDEHLVNALPAFHAFTGSDSTSFFVGRGKKHHGENLQRTQNS
ncbi:hypothetical protein FSP39_024006 [Pinctada imbricata]|uniref:Uncharacterized protein n=1 Tax=Pinctada imbricata TaxID=66713 RepID=A0AA88YJB2_PINIB|nr:hypothetical protein FSP39_024006 [Pinctada imbricata]